MPDFRSPSTRQQLLKRFAAGLAAAGLLAGCAPAGPNIQPIAVAGGPGEAMISAANPLAVEAGLEVLRRGGDAIDAAVAVQAMLGLVEPQSSGIAGGAFITYFDAETAAVSVYNAREKAPAGAAPEMFLGPDGKPLSFRESVVSGRATGVPGVIAGLHAAHRDRGALPWRSLFEHTATTAQGGFTVSPRLAMSLSGASPQMAPGTDARAFFSRPDGSLLQAGDLLRNPRYAAVLRRIAAEGPSAFYSGPVAQAIVDRTRAGPVPGAMTLQDLAAYQAEKVEPLCGPYRVYVVCVPPPPSSGVGLLQLLAILDGTDVADRGPADPRAWFLFAEASRIMYADRDRYVGDPRFVSVPVAGMLAPAYVAERARLIGDRAGPPPPPGQPAGAPAVRADGTREPAGTTHFVIVDRDGDVVSMTTTVESIFGSGRMVEGFMLNNQLTDFSFSPTAPDGGAMANAVAPGKQPRSSMAPAVVLDRQGRFVAAVGSPGGNAILAYNGKALLGLLGWNLSMQQAIDLPNLVARGAAFNGEASKFPVAVLEGLRALGVDVKSGSGEGSGLHGVARRPTGLEGGADPRREGVARRP